MLLNRESMWAAICAYTSTDGFYGAVRYKSTNALIQGSDKKRAAQFRAVRRSEIGARVELLLDDIVQDMRVRAYESLTGVRSLGDLPVGPTCAGCEHDSCVSLRDAMDDPFGIPALSPFIGPVCEATEPVSGPVCSGRCGHESCRRVHNHGSCGHKSCEWNRREPLTVTSGRGETVYGFVIVVKSACGSCERCAAHKSCRSKRERLEYRSVWYMVHRTLTESVRDNIAVKSEQTITDEQWATIGVTVPAPVEAFRPLIELSGGHIPTGATVRTVDGRTVAIEAMVAAVARAVVDAGLDVTGTRTGGKATADAMNAVAGMLGHAMTPDGRRGAIARMRTALVPA